MLDFKKFGNILKEIEKEDLFNQFIINLLDYNMLDIDNNIIRYKINNGLIIDVFNYIDGNKFTRYYFTELDNRVLINDNIIIKVINIKEYYHNFDKYNKYSLFSLIFYEKDINVLEENLTNLFCVRIKNIIMKHLKI